MIAGRGHQNTQKDAYPELNIIVYNEELESELSLAFITQELVSQKALQVRGEANVYIRL